MGENAYDGTFGKKIETNTAVFMSIAAFTAVAWYNIFELNVQVFLTFKRHRGLYFWSLLISGYGCVLHALGFLLKFFQLTDNNYISVTIITIGWYAMVTGQAVVLYSRLHLVVREQRVLRGILAMIIVDAICFHIPTTVLTYGVNSFHTDKSNRYTRPFNIVERLQMTAFCVQEFIISGVYVWSTLRLLRPVYHGRTRKVMMQLIWINLIIICMDGCLLAMEYSNNYTLEASLKAMVYSIKLKLEFAVLNQLMTLANSSVNAHQALQIEDGEKSSKPTAGRSKSTEYISKKYEKPSKREQHEAQDQSSQQEANNKGSTLSRHSSFGANGTPSKAHFQWIPTLDRNCVVETVHMEDTKRRATEPELNALNNPAAHYKPPRRLPIQDKYGYIADEDDNRSMLSPSLTGTTLHAPSPRADPRVSNFSHPLAHPLAHPSRRRAPPPNLEFENPVMANGLIRSTRPSVSEWGRGPDSEASPNSDEVQLNPYEQSAMSPRSPGSVQAGRQRATQCVGVDFMTSALRE